jgi:hypothetical protein
VVICGRKFDERDKMEKQITKAIIYRCAEAAHEMNRIYCESHGDTSQNSWRETEDSIRQSAISGVEVALRGATPKQQHEAWSSFKVSQGWKYGEVKDLEKKEHPCLIPYEQLSVEQQKKDSLYISTVTAMFNALQT